MNKERPSIFQTLILLIIFWILLYFFIQYISGEPMFIIVPAH